MKKIILLLIFTSLLHSCSSDSNGSNNNNNISNTIPIGTTVKLEASISGGNTIAVVQYKDGQGNLISLSNVPIIGQQHIKLLQVFQTFFYK